MPHMFLLWASKYDENPFPKNWEIINRTGSYGFSKRFVYWGKFFRQEDEKGASVDLESYYGEAYDTVRGIDAVNKLNADIGRGNPVYLYLYNPLAPDSKLQIANVREAFYTSGELPPSDEDERPACAHIPSYYFHRKLLVQCSSCKKRKPECKMRFFCNFWFKIDNFKEIEDENLRQETELNLEYADDLITKIGTEFSLTRGQVFPILVSEKKKRNHFLEITSLLPKREPKPFNPRYKKGHKGEKYGRELHSFFRELWDKVPCITDIDPMGEAKRIQENYFVPYKEQDNYNIIEGGRKFKYGKKNWTLVFLLPTTCRNEMERDLLIKYLNEQFCSDSKKGN
jgi:hypothetical protein